MSHEIFSIAYTKLYRPLCYYALVILKVKQDAEDIVQDAFVKLYFTDLTEPECKPYLLIMVRNKCLNNKRHFMVVEKTHKLLSLIGSDKSKDGLDECIRFETISLIYEQIENLPPERKKVFKLAYLEMFSNREIADLLHLSPFTVKEHKAFALRFLREKFGSDFKFRTGPKSQYENDDIDTTVLH